jgi:hypothetical protein
MSIFEHSEFIPPADTTPRDTEHLSVANLIKDVPRLDGRMPGDQTSGQQTSYLDDDPPGKLPRRQSEMPLTERPSWHVIETPAPVAALWAETESLQEKADDIREAVEALPGEKAAERRQVEAEMAAAIRAGKPADNVGQLTDWTRRQLALVTEHKVAVAELRSKRAEYDRAVAEATPAWRDRLVAAVAPARKRAQELVGPALAAVAEWQVRISAAHQMCEALDPSIPNPSVTLVGDRGVQLREGRRAPEKLAALLADDDPRVTGEYLTLPDDGVRPTRWEREAMAQHGAFGGWAELAFIEDREDYTVTAYTRKRERQSVAPSAPFRLPDGTVLID